MSSKASWVFLKRTLNILCRAQESKIIADSSCSGRSYSPPSRTKSLKEHTKETAAEVKKHQMQLELNKYKSTREDEKQHRTEILIDNNEER